MIKGFLPVKVNVSFEGSDMGMIFNQKVTAVFGNMIHFDN